LPRDVEGKGGVKSAEDNRDKIVGGGVKISITELLKGTSQAGRGQAVRVERLGREISRGRAARFRSIVAEVRTLKNKDIILLP